MHNLPLNLPAPPRAVPLSLRVVNFFNGLAQLGWGLFGFGFLFFVMFGLNADFSFITFRNPEGRTTGRVTRVEDTRASENDSRIRASHYQYSVAGTSFEGKSYTTGSAPSAGDAVEVEYDEDRPERSRIIDMRRAMFGVWAAPVSAIFPLIGLILLVFGTRSGIRRNHLLRHGIIAAGTLKRKLATNVRINGRQVFELIFEFTDRHGQRREASARTADTHRLEDEATEPLFYDPSRPERAYVLDEAPARPRFEMNGDMVGRPGAAIASLILPTIVIGAYTLLFLFRYGTLSS